MSIISELKRRNVFCRAMAVELLWKALNKHRNAARKAYVRPLKEAIERLGAIVFGTGFEVEPGVAAPTYDATFRHHYR